MAGTGLTGARGPRGEVVPAVAAAGHLRVHPSAGTGAGLLDRHSPANGVRFAARRARVQLHPHRPGGPLPADAGQARLLPAGLGRQRPAHRTARPEPLRGSLRTVAALRPRLHPAGQARPKAAAADQPTQLRRAVPRTDRRRRAGLRRPVAPGRVVGRLGPAVHHDLAGGRRWRSGPSCGTSPRRGLPPRPPRCGMSPTRPRWRRPSWRPASTELLPAINFHRPGGGTC